LFSSFFSRESALHLLTFAFLNARFHNLKLVTHSHFPAQKNLDCKRGAWHEP
jgi:hypothetical protein